MRRSSCGHGLGLYAGVAFEQGALTLTLTLPLTLTPTLSPTLTLRATAASLAHESHPGTLALALRPPTARENNSPERR